MGPDGELAYVIGGQLGGLVKLDPAAGGLAGHAVAEHDEARDAYMG